ncbi:MAG: NAD(P)H-dependent oxidoreductase [Saccharospirillaceae bacterium]|nr:NAD(P)H-dependent oxidoreductase [Saccharospirillaceae bacterium]MCD8532924.1 NAD(P)H-dependent oxidoreductase [Saccharospirillaceae bacterium]
MATLLYIKGSIFGDHGQSSQLAEQFIAGWKAANQNGEVVIRDLATDVPPYLDANSVGAFMTPAEQRTAEQQSIVAYSDALIAEIKAADEVVVGVPMYNFTIPAQMKSYLDFLCRAGVTFKYTETGPVGLLDNKPVHILATRGGLYQGTPADTQTPFLTTIFSFIGLSDVRFVYAEGLNLGDDSKNAALAAASREIAALA